VTRTAYVLPLRWTHPGPVAELTGYLGLLASRVDEVVVVDGSPPERFAEHHAHWQDLVHHVPPDPRFACTNGKVQGVHTGIATVSAERVVIADDDVRYDEVSLECVFRALEHADLAWPQNFFDPLPWHARWDTARTLLNRAFGHDFPGTVGVLRSTFLAMDGYEGDVLWENLELRRTVRAGGGRVADLPDVPVRRLPPTAAHFWSQRVRQAYDEFARPAHLAVYLGIAPATVWAGLHRPRALVAAVAASAAFAELGRRRRGGTAVFPPSASLLAPVWLLERGVCTWLAVATRIRHGGVRYHGAVLTRAATPTRTLRARRSGRRARRPQLEPA
jgi:hypothetical protein